MHDAWRNRKNHATLEMIETSGNDSAVYSRHPVGLSFFVSGWIPSRLSSDKSSR